MDRSVQRYVVGPGMLPGARGAPHTLAALVVCGLPCAACAVHRGRTCDGVLLVRAPLPQTHHNADVPKVLSEDCLNVNVFVPAWANDTSKLPVMLFFYGGCVLSLSCACVYGHGDA